jgi:hypothetical protein
MSRLIENQISHTRYDRTLELELDAELDLAQLTTFTFVLGRICIKVDVVDHVGKSPLRCQIAEQRSASTASSDQKRPLKGHFTQVLFDHRRKSDFQFDQDLVGTSRLHHRLVTTRQEPFIVLCLVHDLEQLFFRVSVQAEQLKPFNSGLKRQIDKLLPDQLLTQQCDVLCTLFVVQSHLPIRKSKATNQKSLFLIVRPNMVQSSL